MANKTRQQNRKKRQVHIRKRVVGTLERPRLNVFRSQENLYAQIIDDARGHTLVNVSSLDPDVKSKKLRGIEVAKLIGTMLAQKAIQEGVTRVVFDRAGYRYHGRVKALADGAREGGLEF